RIFARISKTTNIIFLIISFFVGHDFTPCKGQHTPARRNAVGYVFPISIALKGQHTLRFILYCPFRALDIKNSRFPPRCGGLDYIAPLGRWEFYCNKVELKTDSSLIYYNKFYSVEIV
ncbi:MAG: hypothetical protein LBQ66_07960, partial [Planctomycetaceae bacterium]|nr:hypothetical protein [Planctomycetaceae bacterium]